MSSYHQKAVIYFSPAFEGTENCGTQKNKAIIRYEEEGNTRKEMYSLAMAAAMSGKSVNLGISGCDGEHPKVYRVDLKL